MKQHSFRPLLLVFSKLSMLVLCKWSQWRKKEAGVPVPCVHIQWQLKEWKWLSRRGWSTGNIFFMCSRAWQHRLKVLCLCHSLKKKKKEVASEINYFHYRPASELLHWNYSFWTSAWWAMQLSRAIGHRAISAFPCWQGLAAAVRLLSAPWYWSFDWKMKRWLTAWYLIGICSKTRQKRDGRDSWWKLPRDRVFLLTANSLPINRSTSVPY